MALPCRLFDSWVSALTQIDREEARESYKLKKPQLKYLQSLVGEILDREIEESEIKTHNIESRVKELDSLIKKAKAKNADHPVEAIDDLLGFRVVCRFLSEVEKIGELLRSNFEVLKEDDKIEGLEDHAFEYMSVHFVCQLGDGYKDTALEEVAEEPFEIQVRTIAMDAWASISHVLDYKSEEGIPSDLRKDFYGLSGLFYVADKHFELFYQNRQETEKGLEESLNRGLQVLNHTEINLESLKVYLGDAYPDRDHAESRDLSGLAKELSAAGYKTLGEVHDDLEQAEEALEAYEADHGPFKVAPHDIGDDPVPIDELPDVEKLNRVGAARVALGISNQNFRDVRPDTDEMLEEYEEHLTD